MKWDISIVSENLTKTDKELRTIEEYHKLINYYLRCFYLLSHILVTESNLLAIERMWQMYHITNHSSWQRDAVICEKCANLLRRYYDTPLPIKQKASLLSTDIKVMK